jgi:hypothetical protein
MDRKVLRPDCVPDSLDDPLRAVELQRVSGTLWLRSVRLVFHEAAGAEAAVIAEADLLTETDPDFKGHAMLLMNWDRLTTLLELTGQYLRQKQTCF